MQIHDHHQRAINRRDLCDYDGDFVDGKIINLEYLEGVAEKGNEPSRAASQLALFERVRDFQDWGVSDLEAYTWFMTDVECSWMSGKTPIEDW